MTRARRRRAHSIYDKEMDLRITLVKRPLGAGSCPFVDDEAECSEENTDYDDDEEEEGEDDDVFREREMEEQGVSIRPRRRNNNVATGDAAQLEGLAKPARRRQGRKKLQHVPGLSIVESALVRMPKYDSHCLFYAVVVAQLYSVLMKRNVPNRAQIAYHQTERLTQNLRRLKDEAAELMWNAEIQQGQRESDLTTQKKSRTISIVDTRVSSALLYLVRDPATRRYLTAASMRRTTSTFTTTTATSM